MNNRYITRSREYLYDIAKANQKMEYYKLVFIVSKKRSKDSKGSGTQYYQSGNAQELGREVEEE